MIIKGKVIVITGASSGLGRETAIQLSRLGAEVVLVARSEIPQSSAISFVAYVLP